MSRPLKGAGWPSGRRGPGHRVSPCGAQGRPLGVVCHRPELDGRLDGRLNSCSGLVAAKRDPKQWVGGCGVMGGPIRNYRGCLLACERGNGSFTGWREGASATVRLLRPAWDTAGSHDTWVPEGGACLSRHACCCTSFSYLSPLCLGSTYHGQACGWSEQGVCPSRGCSAGEFSAQGGWGRLAPIPDPCHGLMCTAP